MPTKTITFDKPIPLGDGDFSICIRAIAERSREFDVEIDFKKVVAEAIRLIRDDRKRTLLAGGVVIVAKGSPAKKKPKKKPTETVCQLCGGSGESDERDEGDCPSCLGSGIVDTD